MSKVCVVVGVGPGIGGAMARKFAAEGWTTAVVARRQDAVDELAAEIGGTGYVCDATDEEQLNATFTQIAADLGPVHTLLWNVGGGGFGNLDQVGSDAFDLAFQTNTRGLFTATKAVVGAMRAAGEGNLIITGATASRRGKPFTTAFAAGKAAQRSLAQSLARQLWPEGIHVGLIIVDGMVDLPRSRQMVGAKPDGFFIEPEGVAETALFLCRQRRSAWTFELEVRPHIESW